MTTLFVIIHVSWLARITDFVGGVIALVEGTEETEGKRELEHGILALGGGTLVAAVAFALVPPVMENLLPSGQQRFHSEELLFAFLIAASVKEPEIKHSSWQY